MKKEQVLARMKEDCLVAVVRAKNYEQGEKVAVSYTHLDVYKRQYVHILPACGAPQIEDGQSGPQRQGRCAGGDVYKRQVCC